MAKHASLKDLLTQLDAVPERTIVLVDMKNGGSVCWGKFSRPYEVSTPVASPALFEETRRVLDVSPSNSVFDASHLPILFHIGGFKTTVVIRNSDDTLTFKNLNNVPVELLMGLG